MKLEQLFPNVADLPEEEIFSMGPDFMSFVREKRRQRAFDLQRMEEDRLAEEAAKSAKRRKPRKVKKEDDVQLTQQELALIAKLGITKNQLLKMRE